MNDAAPAPVDISIGARNAMQSRVRQWSGWSDATLVFGTPTVSPWADTEFDSRTITANADVLVLNPNRVLRTLTPFRLRQEAILTGALIHEAGHARFSRWLPRNKAEAAVWKHADGTEITTAEVAFARMVEEARIEGHMSANATEVHIVGLDWTMRATVAYLLPFTDLSPQSDKQLMQLINSWALRAGRAIAVGHWTGRPVPQWANDFSSLVHQRIEAHLLALRGLSEDDALFGGDDKGANADTREVINLIRSMMVCEDHTGTAMVDIAKRVLSILFPETDPDDMPTPEAGCDGVPEDNDDEGESDPSEDEGASDGDQADDQAAGESESETDEDGSEGEPEDGEGDASSDVDGGASPSTEAGDSDADNAAANDLADVQAALEDIEAASQREAKAEQAEQAAAAPTQQEQVALGASDGPTEQAGMGDWRHPTKTERETQASAGKMLREMIEPTESSKSNLTETPAANVDGAAMAAWRAAGARRDPRFFIRHTRQVQPSPPVQIAVLVDVSASMDVLQEPSALLSWSLAAAALDLRNFAGRGTQVESTLIHWGSTAEVIQRNGELLPGIKVRPCRQGTTVMGDALRLVEEQIPGFFDTPATPVNRLLINFTDWLLAPWCKEEVTPMIRSALDNGINMLSIVPWARFSDLEDIVDTSARRERSKSIVYNKNTPDIWPDAAKMLR